MSILRTIWYLLTDEEFRPHLIYTILLLVIGSIFYHHQEGWTWVDSSYFSVITLTTVGYGDLHPQTDGGKIFTIVYIMIGIGILLSFLNIFGEKFIEHRTESVRKFKKKNKKKTKHEDDE